jgi:TolB-like protein/Flp pilus assembly protein TadD
MMYCLDDGNWLLAGPTSGNIEAPTQVFAIPALTDNSPEQRPNSIAVLPFIHLSNDPDNDYFCDGLAEELINSLSRLDDLKVVARSSSFSFKGRNVDVAEVGSILNVNHVVEGSVRRSGDRLRINVQLTNVLDGYNVWSNKFDAEMRDIFDVQDEIASSIVEALRKKLSLGLSEADKQQLAKRPTDNLQAFQFYIQGRSFAQRRTREDLLTAIRYYEQAIAEDNNYALAFAGLAEVYGASGIRSYISPDEGRRKAVEAAQRAIELDDDLAEAHTALALTNVLFAPHDFALADRELRRALELNPSSATAHMYIALSASRQGRLDEIDEYFKAREFDPLSPIIVRSMAAPCLFKRDYAQALEILQQSADLGPPFIVPWEIDIYIQNGLFEDALAKLETAKLTRKDDPILNFCNGMVYAARGNRDEALKVVSELETIAAGTLDQAHHIAKIYAMLDEREMALDQLERGLAAGQIGDFFKDEPVWDPIRDDSRFRDLLQNMGYGPESLPVL